jgi:zinc and cadmium transporter
LGGLLVFLLFEQVLHLHHEHRHDCDDCKPKKVTGYSILLVDGMHNFLDGVLIASAFMVSPTLGMTTTLAVIIHEVPQELGDYAVLVHSGFKPAQALGWNLVSALTAMVGGLFGYFFLSGVERLVPYFVAVGAGGLMYIALVDLMGEIRAHSKTNERWGQIVAMLVGLGVLVLLMRVYAHE